MSDRVSKKELQILEDFLKQREISFTKDYNMGDYSSWKVGATTKIIIFPDDIDTFKECISKLNRININFFITGNATNTLFLNLLRTVIISTKKLTNITKKNDIQKLDGIIEKYRTINKIVSQTIR